MYRELCEEKKNVKREYQKINMKIYLKKRNKD